MVEGARLESVYTVTPYRGFESHRLRHFRIPASPVWPIKGLQYLGFLTFSLDQSSKVVQYHLAQSHHIMVGQVVG